MFESVNVDKTKTFSSLSQPYSLLSLISQLRIITVLYTNALQLAFMELMVSREQVLACSMLPFFLADVLLSRFSVYCSIRQVLISGIFTKYPSISYKND